ncbi:DUF1254 domain-containing protein [Phyllobacterium endophyticum]|uniref:DUF1254 domain-containing protein n=1 Tax=Phyllobacterium endophyticum TaxID=1149773 RepID=A0A2P7AR87_9HYPH|nr:DUF1254 domain-containing protein [Phyllobacterium endophyticum]MBB3237390.1 hypothetical protein [Phyllobacterium endophyticum]PSH56732.1 hypothetical protein CU100_15400 [Phyllobacterium endophyticum]TYR44285.1 DUF1254 domain-containing protein [Phyllobacterium endophyticum]
MASTLRKFSLWAVLLAATVSNGGGEAIAQTKSMIPPALVTPDKVESPLGALEFKDGVPSKATADKLYDNLDFTYAHRAFMDNLRGVSIHALRDGMMSIGMKDNEVVVFETLMDAKSLYLTANADTIYVMGFLDLSKGPVVVETPPKFLGAVQDAWFRWVIDLGAPGPDRGEGGKYLIVGPDYTGTLPQGGFFVARARTNSIVWFGRSFLESHNDPKPVVEGIKKFTKVYPYEEGGIGTPVADFLAGKTKLGKITPPPPTVFHDGSGKVMNTIPPNDWGFYEMLNEIVQKEPATSLDPELMGPIAAIGIVKGKPFAPDERMKKLMTEALAVANASSRTLFISPRDPSWYYYPNSSWFNYLFETGYEFETPIPEVTPEGVKPYPATGYRTMNERTNFFYGVTGITPGMAMRLTGIGSQYLLAMTDADKNHFDGAKTYKVTLPKGIPEENFWSLTLYDNMTRSMLDTPQRYPRAGSQNYPSPAAEAAADGSTTVYFGPSQPDGVPRGNWIQTDPKKGWFTILRLYSPTEPFFTKEWRLSEIELVN